MFNKKFVSIGVGKILDLDYKSNNICSDSNHKPTKGLWSSEYYENGDSLSDWQDFYYDEDEQILDYSIFELNKNAKIIVLDKKEDVYKYPGYILEKELDELILKECIDTYCWLNNEEIIRQCKKFGGIMFEKVYRFKIFNMINILSDYDGIYLSENFISEISAENYHWKDWDVNTLVVFNIDCINIIEEVSGSIKDKESHVSTLNISKTNQWICNRCTAKNTKEDSQCMFCGHDNKLKEEIYEYSFVCPECNHLNTDNRIYSIKECTSCNTNILMKEANYI